MYICILAYENILMFLNVCALQVAFLGMACARRGVLNVLAVHHKSHEINAMKGDSNHAMVAPLSKEGVS